MTVGRTVTFIEQEVDAVTAAVALWRSTYPVAADYPGTPAAYRTAGGALERVTGKLAEAKRARDAVHSRESSRTRAARVRAEWLARMGQDTTP